MSGQDGSATPPTTAREEAERLVAAGLAAVSMAADRIGAPSRERGGAAAAGFDALGDALFGPSSHRRHSVATGSEECCRCPVCRVISAARQPDPRVAERLATGVGDLAEGAARVLRTLAGTGPEQPTTPADDAARADEPAAPPAGDAWAAATGETGPGGEDAGR
jgi:hypothetical protein